MKICSKGFLDQEIRTVSIFKNRFFIPHVIPRHCEKATYIAMHSELKDFFVVVASVQILMQSYRFICFLESSLFYIG